MIKVTEFDKNIFPVPFFEYLPTVCDSCGAPIEVMESLDYLQCSNRRCISKVAYRLYLLLKDIGVTYLSVKECQSFLESVGSTNPYSIFLYNPSEDGELFDGYCMTDSIKLYEEINKQRGMLLWEFVKRGNFQGLQDSAVCILRNYTSLTSFYADMLDGGIPFIQELLLKNTEYENTEAVSVKAVIIYETFVYFQADFEEGLNGVVIIEPKTQLGILFATDCTTTSNAGLLYKVNKYFKNEIRVSEFTTLTSDVKLVYWEEKELGATNTLVEEIKENHPSILLVNSDNICTVINSFSGGAGCFET